ncbi:MAG: hypothetical protein K9J06_05075 [Flavobacteriales bacterium]|nr:hypothetical protein [Flavobacteriales bacterium]
MRKIPVLIILCFCVLAVNVKAQDDFSGGNVWSSVFLSKKITPRWYFNNYLLVGFKESGQLAFVQNDLSFRYRFDRFWSMGVGYKHAQYAAYPGIDKIYPQSVTSYGSIIFHGAEIDVQFDRHLGKSFWISQSLIVQGYFPRFEKYQFRYISRTKLAYRNKKAFLHITPYVTFMLYYYHNGKPFNYYDENGDIEAYRSPNGFHRYRAIVGFSFKPTKKISQLGFNFYYAINREFNFSNSNSPLNVRTPTAVADGSNVKVPFNNYNIFGVQVNIILGMNKGK